MKKTLYSGILTCLLACLCMACSPLAATSATQSPGPETETPAPTDSPTETATLAPLPTVTLAPATPTSPFAPICELSVASTLAVPLCQGPIAEQSSAFCMNKTPFNLILLDEGATYELLSEGFVCSDSGMKDGKQVLTCTGPMGTSFELRACNQQACALPTPAAESLQCPSEFWYDQPQGCCAFIPPSVEPSCVLLTLQTKRCTINCAEFTKVDACNNHYHACQWNDEENVCQVRR